MLEVKGLHAGYGAIKVLEDVSISVGADQIVCILGANGAGKSTTLNCISGIVEARSGTITFDGDDITNAAIERTVARGLVQVPEGREIFAGMSVEDNLTLGAWTRADRKAIGGELDRVFDIFPRLKDRTKQFAGTLSGGEQQMLMIGRALMAKPKLIMFDEPSLGLSPIMVQLVFETIKRIHREGTPVLLVEQNIRVALDVSSYGYILQNGEIIHEGSSEQLKQSPEVREAYLGEQRETRSVE
jgi:branched-chain amino acid transport system ATP-binding protein